MGRRGGGIPASVRRLRLKGWSIESIARLYRLARAEVVGMLSCALPAPAPPPDPPVPSRSITGGLAASVRRLHAAGEPIEAIGAALAIDIGHLSRYLARCEVDPWRPIKGRLATACRRRHGAGESAEAIAEDLALDPAHVAGFLERTFPPPKPPRERTPRLRKPRPKDPPRWPDWHHSNGPEFRESAEALPPPDVAADVARADADGVAEGPAPGASPAMPADWGAMHRPRPGALDEDDVVRVRYWRSRRVALEDLARWFGCSVATIKRALRPDYRPAPSSPNPAPLPPQIAAAEASEMVRWDPADDD